MKLAELWVRRCIEMICPRCHEDLRPDCFVMPVQMCMLCYSKHPGNKGLSMIELRIKAQRSKWSRLRESRMMKEADWKRLRGGDTSLPAREQLTNIEFDEQLEKIAAEARKKLEEQSKPVDYREILKQDRPLSAIQRVLDKAKEKP